jgi:hypothetical protein
VELHRGQLEVGSDVLVLNLEHLVDSLAADPLGCEGARRDRWGKKTERVGRREQQVEESQSKGSERKRRYNKGKRGMREQGERGEGGGGVKLDKESAISDENTACTYTARTYTLHGTP